MANEKGASASIASQIKRLLKERSSPNDRQEAARLDELRRVLTNELNKCASSNDTTPGTATLQWRRFLCTARSSLMDQLCKRVHHVSACRTILGLLAVGDDGLYSNGLLAQFYTALVHHDDDPLQSKPIRTMLVQEFLKPFYDTQYYTLRVMAVVANQLFEKKKSKKTSTASADRLLDLLLLVPLAESQEGLDGIESLLPTTIVQDSSDDDSDAEEEDDGNSDSDNNDDGDIEEDDEESPKAKSKGVKRKSTKNRPKTQRLRLHRSAWTKAWLAVLRLPLSGSGLRRALKALPIDVLPVTSQPLRFADFFMHAYSDESSGSMVIPVLALEGLFMLMTQHGLEYPSYYKQLYRIIKTPAFLYLQHRETFCRLLDASLARNALLPAHIVASFCKRLLRNCLEAPPHGCLYLLALVSHLLQHHPEISMLVHRSTSTKMKDPFDAVTDDPHATNALQSSAWELDALQHHSCAAVVVLAQSVGTPQQQQHLEKDDFLKITYTTLFEQERLQRKKKRKTALQFVKPKGLLWGNGEETLSTLIAQPAEGSNE